MKVCRIVKADISVKVGEVLTASKAEHNYSEKRAKAESLLEEVRKRDYSDVYGRENSLFVFPYDDKLEERAFQWARTYAPNPDSSCPIYLLELDVDKVEWHDVVYYEDLCFLLNDEKRGMSDITANKDELCKKYWQGICGMNEVSIEGLVNSAKVVSVTPCKVTHNKILFLKR